MATAASKADAGGGEGGGGVSIGGVWTAGSRAVRGACLPTCCLLTRQHGRGPAHVALHARHARLFVCLFVRCVCMYVCS